MKKVIVICMPLLLSLGLLAQDTTKRENRGFFKRQMRSIEQDLRLFRKCYLSTSRACSKNERDEAFRAAGRLGIKTLGLIGFLGGMTIGAPRLYKWVQGKKSLKKLDLPPLGEFSPENVQKISEEVKTMVTTQLKQGTPTDIIITLDQQTVKIKLAIEEKDLEREPQQVINTIFEQHPEITTLIVEYPTETKEYIAEKSKKKVVL